MSGFRVEFRGAEGERREAQPAASASPASSLRQKARELMVLAEHLHDRIGDEGQILGWRGFHMDLDALVSEAEELRKMVRR